MPNRIGTSQPAAARPRVARAAAATAVRHCRKIIRIERLHPCAQWRFMLELLDEALESRGLDDESGRHGDAGALQLAEAAALAADMRPIGESDVGEPADVLASMHRALLQDA